MGLGIAKDTGGERIHLIAAHGDVIARQCVTQAGGQGVLGSVVEIELAITRLAERVLHHLGHGGAVQVQLRLILQLSADFDFILGGGIGDGLDGDFTLDLIGVGEGRADLLKRRILREFNSHQRATPEIDAVVQTALQDYAG